MENIENNGFIEEIEESPIEVINWGGSVEFSEYEDLRDSNYLESTNTEMVGEITSNNSYDDELESKYWNSDLDDGYNYWKMKKWYKVEGYDKEQEVSDVLQDTYPKGNKQTKSFLKDALSSDYYPDLAA